MAYGQHDEHHGRTDDRQDEKLDRILYELRRLVAGQRTELHQGAHIMDQMDDLSTNLADLQALVDQILTVNTDSDAEKVRLRAQVADFIATAAIDAAAKAALQEKIAAAWAASEKVENDLRAKVPGMPPVGGTPLLTTYADKAAFDAAVAAYTGPEAVTLDGAEVKTGTAPALAYYLDAAAGGVSNVPPVVVGPAGLDGSYADRAAFDAAVAAYTGPEAVNLDAVEVKAGTAPALEYVTDPSGTGGISVVGGTATTTLRKTARSFGAALGGGLGASSYTNRAEFDAAVGGYKGDQAITLNGNGVRPGKPPGIGYFTHSGAHNITNKGPQD
jgi:hypothetical protein